MDGAAASQDKKEDSDDDDDDNEVKNLECQAQERIAVS